MRRLENKVAVITGAGKRHGTSYRGSRRKEPPLSSPILTSRGGESAVRECKENGGNAVFQKADVSSKDQVKAMIDRAVVTGSSQT